MDDTTRPAGSAQRSTGAVSSSSAAAASWPPSWPPAARTTADGTPRHGGHRRRPAAPTTDAPAARRRPRRRRDRPPARRHRRRRGRRHHQDRLRQPEDRPAGRLRRGRRLHLRRRSTRASSDGIRSATRPTRSRSSPRTAERTRTAAAEVAREADRRDGIDLMLVASTPETTNPVADQCEANGVPCISSRGAVAAVVLRPRRHAGADASRSSGRTTSSGASRTSSRVFLDMWAQVDTNKMVGGLFPNDGDGNAWGDAELGFPPPLKAAGYTIVDPGRYENLTPGLHRPDRPFKDAERARSSPACRIPPDFTDLLEAGPAAGLHAEGRLDRQGAAVPRARSRRSATTATASRPRCGGARATRSRARWSACRPRSSPTPTQPTPASSGPSRSASPTPCSRWRSTRSTAAGERRQGRRSATPIKATDARHDRRQGHRGAATARAAEHRQDPLVGGQWRKADDGHRYDLVIVDNIRRPRRARRGGTIGS